MVDSLHLFIQIVLVFLVTSLILYVEPGFRNTRAVWRGVPFFRQIASHFPGYAHETLRDPQLTTLPGLLATNHGVRETQGVYRADARRFHYF